MGERRGIDTDRVGIAELFAEDRASRARVRDYLSTQKEHELRKRDHFWTAADPGARLVQAKLRALDATPDAFVGKAVAALYCGVSEPEFDRRVRLQGGLSKLTLQGDSQVGRTTDEGGALIPGNRTNRRYRMGFVKKVKAGAGSATVGKTKARKAPAASAPRGIDVRVEATADSVVITLCIALTEVAGWVADANGKLVCHIARNGLAPADLARVLTSGGDIQRLTLCEALTTRVWANGVERAAWADGYALLLDRERAALAHVAGASAAGESERKLEGALPPGRAAIRKRRLQD